MLQEDLTFSHETVVRARSGKPVSHTIFQVGNSLYRLPFRLKYQLSNCFLTIKFLIPIFHYFWLFECHTGCFFRVLFFLSLTELFHCMQPK